MAEQDEALLLSEFLKIRDNCRVIVEIGVLNRTWEYSSTKIFISNKKDETVYLGIDTKDRSRINNIQNNIHVLSMDSKNRERAMATLNELGQEEIDFLFIDGHHSVNQVVEDWQYTQYVSKHGVIAMHDTSVHPGPHVVFDAIDETLFDKQRYFEEDTDCFGIAIVRRK